VIGLGFVGYGYWGPNLVRNFADAADCRVVAVADRRPDRLALAARRYPGLRTTTDVADLLADGSIDAIAIASPVATHFELALAVLRAGKHVLVEKPLATSSLECARLIEEATRRGLVLMVDHTFVYTGAVRKIRELVAADALGDLYYYDATRVNLGLFQHDVNVLWDLAVHDLSILDHIQPLQPVAVSATGVSHLPDQPENIAYLTLFYEGSLIAHIHVNWLAPVKLRRTLIGGSKKMIVYDDVEPSEKIRVYDKGVYAASDETAFTPRYRSGDMWAPNLDVAEALTVEADHFLACIRDNRRPITDGESGLRVVQTLEAASRSLAARGHLQELLPV
jgi:predicted dehydrogenase